METWNITKKQKQQKITMARSIADNSQRVLYILHNLGPQRFTDIIDYSELSRSTVNKYLAGNISPSILAYHGQGIARSST